MFVVSHRGAPDNKLFLLDIRACVLHDVHKAGSMPIVIEKINRPNARTTFR